MDTTGKGIIGKMQSFTDLESGFYTGNRIPVDYFETMGKGESELSIHSGSYHLALKDAGIEMCNVITYSSILPGIAKKTDRPEIIPHGSVLESIMSVCSAGKGVMATAGIIYSWLYDRTNGSKYGGLVCEHQGHFDTTEMDRQLKASMEEIYQNGFSEDYYLGDPTVLTESFIPEKKYGTALVALCFTSFYHPMITK